MSGDVSRDPDPDPGSGSGGTRVGTGAAGGAGRAGRASAASPAGDGWDWVAWHGEYDVPGSGLARRLAAVQAQIAAALDQARPGPLRAVSICAGQGRDLIEVLATHPRGNEVTARLVEINPDNAAAARQLAAAAGLPRVEVAVADAAEPAAYAGLVPADLVLACGVFGNITDEDIQQTIGRLPQLSATGGTVIWTRGRWAPDLVPQICDWFGAAGFEQVWVSDPGVSFGAGAHRFTGPPQPLVTGPAGPPMFRFLTDAEIRRRRGLPPAGPG